MNTLTKLDTRSNDQPHDFNQPVEIPFLLFNYDTENSHKIYNFIENCNDGFSVSRKKLKTTESIKLL